MNMRENMARAMCKKRWPTVDPDFLNRNARKPNWAIFLVEVDAALDVLMVPTQGMIEAAGNWGVGEEGKRAAETLCHNAFVHMIVAAKARK